MRLARPKPPGRLLDPAGNRGARGMIAAVFQDGTGSGLQACSADVVFELGALLSRPQTPAALAEVNSARAGPGC